MQTHEIVANLRQQLDWANEALATGRGPGSPEGYRQIKEQCETRIRELLGEPRSVERHNSNNYPSADDKAWRDNALRRLRSSGIDIFDDEAFQPPTDTQGDGFDDSDMNDPDFRSMVKCPTCARQVRDLVREHRIVHA